MVQNEMFRVDQFAADGVVLLADATGDARGAVHTRPEVVEFILDLVGWKTGEIQRHFRFLEPSAGHADFLAPAVHRLLESLPNAALAELEPMILAVEVNAHAIAICRSRVEALVVASGRSQREARQLSWAWVRHADFLTLPLESNFSHVVGNPPYVRLEALPKPLLRLYRGLWSSLYDRADLYVAFIQKSLGLLRPEGRVGFICADRWMRNRYGKILRRQVSDGFHLEVNVDFTNCPAFLTEVDAYPSVFTIRRGAGSSTRTSRRPEISRPFLRELAVRLTQEGAAPDVSVSEGVVRGEDPWVLEQNSAFQVLRALEGTLPSLEDAGCTVGIGVATGADAVFVGSELDLDVEPSRRLPLLMTDDIRTGEVLWSGQWVLNPFEEDGRLANLAQYPRFKRYIDEHAAVLRARNVAIRNPGSWYRTIDRIHPWLTAAPKLLIPDIKGSAHVVVEEGRYYPHHNLYYVLPGKWPVQALATVMRSRIAYQFVALYCPPLRGGFLRFQAQYLRRIRLPQWADLDDDIQGELSRAEPGEILDDAVRRAFRLSEADWRALEVVTPSFS